MATKNKLSSDEKRWQAESDLSTIQRYNEIMRDKARVSAAQAMAKKQMSEMQNTINAFKCGGRLKKK